MRFDFATAARIVFREGAVADVPALVKELGTRVLVVTGASQERARPLLDALPGVAFAVAGEPTVELIRRGAELARAEACDVVVAIGGGSAIDAGKALAAMLTNPGDPLDYLEVIGRGQALQRLAAPAIAIPTTAGTGSEVTRNAVLASPEHRVKASLRSAGMLPRVAVIDPELTWGLPPAITASTGLDALTQLIEPFVSVKANPMTDMFCREGIRRVAMSLRKAWEDGSDREARSGMAWASLLGGQSLANAALGAVHGFAAPVGGMFPAPHGAVCAAVLPHAMEINIEALRSRAPGSEALRRYQEIGRLLTGRPQATAEDAVWWVEDVCERLEIPGLSAYGVTEIDVPDLVEKAKKASSMKGNPVELTSEELREIVSRAL